MRRSAVEEHGRNELRSTARTGFLRTVVQVMAAAACVNVLFGIGALAVGRDGPDRWAAGLGWALRLLLPFVGGAVGYSMARMQRATPRVRAVLAVSLFFYTLALQESLFLICRFFAWPTKWQLEELLRGVFSRSTLTDWRGRGDMLMRLLTQWGFFVPFTILCEVAVLGLVFSIACGGHDRGRVVRTCVYSALMLLAAKVWLKVGADLFPLEDFSKRGVPEAMEPAASAITSLTPVSIVLCATAVMLSRCVLSGQPVEARSNRRAIGALVLVAVVFAAQCWWFNRSGQIASNEYAAVGSLRTIATQQAIFKNCCEVSQDDDDTGQYGFLAEMCGEVVPRFGSKLRLASPATPVFISTGFRTGASRGKGFAQKRGYCFQVWLPGPNGPMTDTDCDGTPTKRGTCLDPKQHGAAIDLQERHFVLYAWPVEYGKTGRAAFAITEIAEPQTTRGKAASHVPSAWIAVAAMLALFVGAAFVLWDATRRRGSLRMLPPAIAASIWLAGFALVQFMGPPPWGYAPPRVRYSGTTRMPKPNAAFREGAPVFSGRFGNGEGNDGNVWRRIP